jgi:hypothetical protein
MTHTRKVGAALLVVGAFLLFFPFPATVTSIWVITAVGPDGRPVAGCSIEQLWQWRAVGVEHRDVVATDVVGHALFPRRTVRASLARRAWGLVTSAGFHSAPSGRSVQFFGCDSQSQRSQMGIYQWGDTMMYDYRVPEKPQHTSPGR